MNTNPYESPETKGAVSKPEVFFSRRRIFGWLAAIGVIGLVVALLLPVQRGAREPSRRSSCSNNLKQIWIALQTYHDVHGCFPPAYTVDADGKPLHSWRTLILPEMEQKFLYDMIDLSKPWDDPANKAAYDTGLTPYMCPSANLPPNHTTYLAIVAPGSCIQRTTPRKLSEITDGTSLTLMVMEFDSAQAVHWMSPQDASEQMVLDFGKAGNKLSHPGGAQGALVDGSIRFFSAETKPERLRALISIAGKDDKLAEED